MTMDGIEIIPASGPLDATIQPPGSKSITNRALICAAAADGRSTLRGALHSEDTQVMIASLRDVGVDVNELDANTLEVVGNGGVFTSPPGELFIANSGTTIRFLTALLAVAGGRYLLDGVPRMRERPIQDLLDALGRWGAVAESVNGTGCPPVRIQSEGARGGMVSVRGDISSQYLSGLLMAAPLARESVELRVEGELVSKPYVAMTIEVMRAFGVSVDADDLSCFRIAAPQTYQAIDYGIEPDASAASYFWGAAAVAGGRVTVTGLNRNALQGDVEFCDCLAKMGCTVEYGNQEVSVSRDGPLQGVDLDMNAISDTVQTLAAVALFADGPTRVRGVAHNRHKETDRIGDLACELRRVGAEVQEHDDGLTITPRELRPAEIDTYNDHRMAMSMALVGLRQRGIVIKNPRCTEKTYPKFFDDLQHVVN